MIVYLWFIPSARMIQDKLSVSRHNYGGHRIYPSPLVIPSTAIVSDEPGNSLFL
jgi:hypothetical protein